MSIIFILICKTGSTASTSEMLWGLNEMIQGGARNSGLSIIISWYNYYAFTKEKQERQLVRQPEHLGWLLVLASRVCCAQDSS